MTSAAGDAGIEDGEVAVIGMDCRLPGARDPRQFWENLIANRNSIQEIPRQRWDWRACFGDPGEHNKTCSRWGGFVEHIDGFDAGFFEIAPAEAQLMDPQQRLMLELCWGCLEDGGYRPGALAGSNTGVFIGVTHLDYKELLDTSLATVEGHRSTGNYHTLIANRVSYFLDLRGPSLACDTACSSSLFAVHLAVQSINRGECDLALSGGVNAILTNTNYIAFAKKGMLSPTGQCRTFDAAADGYVRGEGGAVVLLKSLRRAVQEQDNIYGVIKGSAINHGGRVRTLTSPNAYAQSQVIQEAYKKARVAPDQVSYIEAHGTGTALGDPLEINGLKRAFRHLGRHFAVACARRSCGIGSVKTNIGHLESAAGIASMIKVLLAFKHRQLPGLLNFRQLNPAIDLDDSPFYLVTQNQPWTPQDGNGPLFAGVSAFGFGGTNAHLVLQSHERPGRPTTLARSCLCVLSARNSSQLSARAVQLLTYLRTHDTRGPILEDLAYTLQVGREPMRHRLALVVEHCAQLEERLERFCAGESQIDCCYLGDIQQLPTATSNLLKATTPQLLQSALQRTDLNLLGFLWTCGVDIDWHALYPVQRPWRISLPTYPFAGDRHWIQADAGTAQSGGQLQVQVLHPLLHSNTSDLRRQCYSSTFSGEEFFLQDHRVHGRKVLPGVVYLEMVRAAIERALPDPPAGSLLELHDVLWVQPFVATAAGQLHLALIPGEQQKLRCRVYSGQRSEEILHCQCDAAFDLNPAPHRLELPQMMREMSADTAVAEQVYAAFARLQLRYGPGHQGIVKLYRGRGQLLAHLCLPSSVVADADQFGLHPSLMDSALQAAAVELGELTGAQLPMLPLSLDRIRLLRPCTTQMYAWVRPSVPDRAGHQSLKQDIDLCDCDGNVCVQLRGFCARPAQEGMQVDEAYRSNAQGLQTLVPVWNPVHRVDGAVRSVAGTLALIGSLREHWQWLRTSFPAAEFIEIDVTASIETIAIALQGCSFDELLWIAPDVSCTDERPDEEPGGLIEAQASGTLFVFRIIKALLRRGFAGKTLRWTVITQRTQRVHAERLTPAHAGVIGLIGSVAKEFPHWDLRLLDVESLDGLTAQECMSLPGSARAEPLAHRHGEWFCRSLAILSNLSAARTAYKERGVYVVIGGAGGLGETWSRFMIEHYQARVVWIGRRQEDVAIRSKIAALARLGPAPVYIAADASKGDELQDALCAVQRIYPRIDGVVHAALVLQDQSITSMQERQFTAALAAKVDVSVNIETLLADQDLDFVLFFSSLIAFTKYPGQCNYAAGCTFKDSFAQYLQQRGACAKVINWGYWGEVGAVAGPSYRNRLQRLGLGSIGAEEAMACLQTFMSGDVAQLACVRVLDDRLFNELGVRELVADYPLQGAAAKRPAQHVLQTEPAEMRTVPAQRDSSLKDMEALLGEMLASLLMEAGFSQRLCEPLTSYKRWLDTSIRYLQQHRLITQDGTLAERVRSSRELWSQWQHRKQDWTLAPGGPARVALLETCLEALPGILTGRRRATDVLFPDASFALVQGIYGDNPVADYFNDTLSQLLWQCIGELMTADPQHKISILEVGAGTGSTTAHLLPMLKTLGAALTEYCYTDVSKAFLFKAQEHYQPLLPALTTSIFDVTAPLQPQSIACDHYDFAIATNVLHATPDIRQALRNIKAALRNRGMVLINEISGWSLFNHLTFGMLEGWWLHQDTPLRCPGGPGLATGTWQRVLREEGLQVVAVCVHEEQAPGQQVILARSDGRIRQPLQAPLAVPATLPRRQNSDGGRLPAITDPAGSAVRQRAFDYVKQLMSATLKLAPDELLPHRPLAEYGLDSILVVQLTNRLRDDFPGLSSSLLFDVNSIDGLVAYLLENRKDELQRATMASVTCADSSGQGAPASGASSAAAVTPGPQRAADPWCGRLTLPRGAGEAGYSRVDVAVIGLAGRYPQSRDIHEFWANLTRGASLITQIPKDRWDWHAYFDPQRGRAGKIYSRWGGFIDDVDRFDPLFFKISPRQATRMDPQERLFLQCCYHALEDAGYTPDNLNESRRVGVFAGVMNSRYTQQPNFFSIANRVSYVFDFQGPSLAVDTACSSSLTAIHLAVESIHSGLSACAIAGGVNVIADPVHYLELSALTMLSSGERCRAFGAQADGFVAAEGVGAVILKPLQQAERDRDNIYAVIKASAINAGGRTNGYTVPNLKGQADVVATALQRAGITAEQITYLEAHGTGTALGDPLEIAALSRAFAQTCNAKQFCAIGSVKSNIGHCESAAGIAGLTKVLLQLRNAMLVPSLHSEITNPQIDFSQTPFRVQQELQPWRGISRTSAAAAGEAPHAPLLAGVSSFGAGGANAHLIVQQYRPARYRSAEPAGGRPTQVIIALSARTSEQLEQKVRDLLEFIRRVDPHRSALRLQDIAYTLQVGRQAMQHRMGCIVASLSELAEKLAAHVECAQVDGVFRGTAPDHTGVAAASMGECRPTFIEECITAQPFSKLLEHWVTGGELQWSQLYGSEPDLDDPPRRISLPLYPFAKERYWSDTAISRGTAESVRHRSGQSSVLHPLVHFNVSTLAEQSYSTSFNAEESVLAQDLWRGCKVLPQAACLEMARFALEHATRAQSVSRVLELHQVVWGGPILVQPGRQVAIAVLAEEGEWLAFEIYGHEDGQEQVYCQGRAVFCVPASQPALDMTQLQARSNPGQLLAKLKPPEQLDWYAPEYFAHPHQLQEALQAARTLIGGSTVTVDSVELVRFVSTTVGKSIHAWIRVAADKREVLSGSAVLDVDLHDSQGQVCVQLRAVSCFASRQAPTHDGHGHDRRSVKELAQQGSGTPVTQIEHCSAQISERGGIQLPPPVEVSVVGAAQSLKAEPLSKVQVVLAQTEMAP